MSRSAPLSEQQLSQLGTEQLLEHMVRARQTGREQEYRLALAMLVWRHEGSIRARVESRLYGKQFHAHVDDVVGEVILSALRASFDSDTLGQFRAWIATIVKFRIADFVDKHSDRPVELTGDGEVPEGETDDETAHELIGISDLVQPVMPGNPAHQDVIRLAVFDDLRAADVAETVNRRYDGELASPMTENNVHQIVSRFRSDARVAFGIEEGDAP